MKRQIFYSLAALTVVLGLTACGGGTGTKTQGPSIAVNSNNTAPVPVVKISDTNVTTGKAVIFDASASYDRDNDPLEFVWKDENGKLLSTDPKLNRVFQTDGVHTMTLEVTDTKGAVAKKSVRVDCRHPEPVPATNQPPVALASVSTATIPSTDAPVTIDVNSGDLVHFTDNGSYDPDGRIVKYEWRDGNGVLLSDKPAFDKKLYYRCECDSEHDNKTSYKVTLCVTDDKGVKSCTEVTIIVHKLDTNQPPVVDLGSDRQIIVGDYLTLRAEANDPDGTIVNYIWEKGSVVVGHGPALSRYTTDYLAVGTHTYCVTVQDNDGAEATDCIDVVVWPTGASGN